MNYPLIDQVFIQGAALLTGLFGILWLLAKLLSYRRRLSSQRSLVDQVNQLLPQTQCGQCGYKGCRPYAKAISGGANINKCPPGGAQTIIQLAKLLQASPWRQIPWQQTSRQETPWALDPAHGEFRPFAVAVIREDECIGCTKCIQACPVDAILGGPKLMHSVITEECSGCDLCVEPCPVDCIDMVTPPVTSAWKWPLPAGPLALPASLQARR